MFLISSFDLHPGEISIHPEHAINFTNDAVNLPTTHKAGANSCILKQSLQNALQLVDCHGNSFQVDASGDYRVQKSDFAGYFLLNNLETKIFSDFWLR